MAKNEEKNAKRAQRQAEREARKAERKAERNEKNNAKDVFFTNTYITGRGRQNYLSADYLEDPLFTSFTFDIDFATSPLFYTINGAYGYPASNPEQIGTNIEKALLDMYNSNMGKNDSGYDILPLMSSYYLNGVKMGFGLQQNVYTDLPLYGATEYIYMVDKRNSSGSQNDVRSNKASKNGNVSQNDSYKLGDSVKTAVSESDKAWAKQQNEMTKAQIEECDKIIASGDKVCDKDGNLLGKNEELYNSDPVYKEYYDAQSNLETAKKNCSNYENPEKPPIIVLYQDANGKNVEEKYYEEDLQKKIDELDNIEGKYNNFKKSVANWVNERLSSWQNSIIGCYSGNDCIKKIVNIGTGAFRTTEEGHWYSGYTKRYAAVEQMDAAFAGNWMKTKVWDATTFWDLSAKQKEGDPFMNTCLILYNKNELYDTVPSKWASTYKQNSDKSTSLLIEKTSGDSKVTVRPSLIQEKFKGDLEKMGFLTKKTDKDGKETGEAAEFNTKITVSLSGTAPSWTQDLPTKLSYLMNVTTDRTGGSSSGAYSELIQTTVVNPLRYKCDPEVDFVELDKISTDKSYKMLGYYKEALERYQIELYGWNSEENKPCSKNDPSPDSIYGKKKEAEEALNNTAYMQSKQSKEILESSEMIKEAGDLSSDTNDLDDDSYEIPVIDNEIEEMENDGIENTFNYMAPQTVLDMLGFILGMKNMISNYPYIINSITGLDTAYNKHYNITDPYLGSGDDKITITCWESLDLRVSSMFNRYFNAVYDRQYRRERVPVNLRRFNCSIYVHDVRNFATSGGFRYDNKLSELNDMYYGVVEFRFYDCEIVAEETGNIFNDISNEAPSEMKKTNFTFKYGNCVVNFAPV